jgi:hypothetical protein
MEHTVWLIGLLSAVSGLAAVVQPLWLKTVLAFLARGRQAYAAAGLKILIGIVWLLFARECRIPSVIITLGILTVVGSVLFAAMPFSKIRAWFQWCQARPLWMFRLWGVLAVLLGVLVVYAGWPIR